MFRISEAAPCAPVIILKGSDICSLYWKGKPESATMGQRDWACYTFIFAVSVEYYELLVWFYCGAQAAAGTRLLHVNLLFLERQPS